MHFIDHIIEPSKLLLTWQSADEKHRTRYVVAELSRKNEEDVSLLYLTTTKDFIESQCYGFEGYPAFQDFNKIHHNVLDAFMRRLPPRTRGDFSQYLEGLRLKPNAQMSDFALLGYSGAKLLSDGFSIIHPFINVGGPCELLLEAAGYRHINNKSNANHFLLGQPVTFSKEFNEPTKEIAIRIESNNRHLGYVNRGLLPTFLNWLENNRIENAWIEKINGTVNKPAVYIFVKIAAN